MAKSTNFSSETAKNKTNYGQVQWAECLWAHKQQFVCLLFKNVGVVSGGCSGWSLVLSVFSPPSEISKGLRISYEHSVFAAPTFLGTNRFDLNQDVFCRYQSTMRVKGSKGSHIGQIAIYVDHRYPAFAVMQMFVQELSVSHIIPPGKKNIVRKSSVIQVRPTQQNMF